MKIFQYLLFVTFFASCASPKALFTAEKQSTHAPATVNFKNQSTKADKYLWEFGDGKTSDEMNPEHRYTLSGNYKVTLNAFKGKKQNMYAQEILLDPPHQCLVEMNTTLGTMIIQLYDETPLHRDNFIKLIESGFYENVLFHRVIKGFMIQGGDPDSKEATSGKRLGSGGPGYTIPAEFVDTLVHVKGALAAARQGDAANPKKESSGSQFYIAHGKPLPSSQIDAMEVQKGMKYTSTARDIFSSLGGIPFLDKDYTVFGRVIKGLEIIDAIADSKTDGADRPLTDVKILSVKIIN